MIDPETMGQLAALSAANRGLREDMAKLAKKLDANNANLARHMEVELGLVRDAANRASQAVAQFGGRLDEFTDQQRRFKVDAEWWFTHLDERASAAEAATKRLEEAEARLLLDHNSFMAWAANRINQIGRIFRR